MGKAKEKKVVLRDVLRAELAQLIMADRGLPSIERTKEGLVVQELGEDGKVVHLIVRVIEKKSLVEKADIVETYLADEGDGGENEAVTADIPDEIVDAIEV